MIGSDIMKIEKLSENQIRCTLNKSDLAARQLKISELAYGSDKAKKLFQDLMQQASYEFGFEAENIPLMIEAIPVSSECIILIVTKVDDPEELDTRFSKFSSSSDNEDYDDLFYPYDDYNPMESIDSLTSAKNELPSADDELTSDDASKASSKEDNSDIFSRLNEYFNKNINPDSDDDKPSKTTDNTAASHVIRCFSFENLDIFSNAAKAVLPVYNDKNYLFKHTNNKRYYLFLEKQRCTSSDFNKTCNILSEYGQKEYLPENSLHFFAEHTEAIIKNRAIQVMAKL